VMYNKDFIFPIIYFKQRQCSTFIRLSSPRHINGEVHTNKKRNITRKANK
jgi:hypothetical protein